MGLIEDRKPKAFAIALPEPSWIREERQRGLWHIQRRARVRISIERTWRAARTWLPKTLLPRILFLTSAVLWLYLTWMLIRIILES